MMDLLKQTAAFVAAAERGSFSADIQLQMSQPTVSKLVAELERQLEIACFTALPERCS